MPSKFGCVRQHVTINAESFFGKRLRLPVKIRRFQGTGNQDQEILEQCFYWNPKLTH